MFAVQYGSRKNILPKLVAKATLGNQGKFDYRYNGQLLTIVWVDKCSIYKVTNFHAVILVKEELRIKRHKTDGWRGRS